MSADVIARGLAAQLSRNLSTSGSSTGAALVGFTGASAGSTTRTTQDKLRELVSVKDFGAKGDGVTDDTAAIQAAIQASLTTSGGRLFVPKGTYRLTDKLVISASFGWRLEGESRLASRLVQHGTNKPILSFETNSTHSFEVEGLTFSWNVQQTAAEPGSIALRFGTGTTSHTMFQFVVRSCHFEKGWRGISQDSAAPPTLWGVTIDNCTFGNTMTGAAIRLVASAGQPRILICNTLFDMAAATEDFVQISTADTVTLLNSEWLNGSSGKRLCFIGSVEQATLIGCRSESYAVGATSSQQLFGFANARVLAISTVVTGVTGTGSAYCLYGTTSTTLSVLGLTVNSAMTAGALYAYTSDAAVPIAANIKLNATGTGNATDNVFALTGCAPKIDADKRQKDWVSDTGDTNAVLTATSARTQYAGTTLTANRTITLPNASLYEGMEFEIVRKAATPGAFTLQVVDPIAANNHTIAASANGYVRYRYRGNWRIMAAGAL